ncbi:MAG: hypothetical protein IT462_00270 [Planctomycetes bacterium]|nr:hypothetical protein [Planctomycetota bacterium]
MTLSRFASRGKIHGILLLLAAVALVVAGCDGSEGVSSVAVFKMLKIATPSISGASVGNQYSSTIEASGGSEFGYDWAVVGALPPGLSIAAHGTPTTTIAGLPTLSGVYNFGVRCVDSRGETVTNDYTLVVQAANLTITTTTLPSSMEGHYFTAPMNAIYGSGTGYVWTVNAGSTLPPGLTLSPLGAAVSLWGTPTQRGDYTFTIRVTDSDSGSVTHTFQLTVDPPLEIVTTLLPQGAQTNPYNAVITAAGGSGFGHTWDITAGSLPDGLAIVQNWGNPVLISGSPAEQGVFSFTLRVTDNAQNTASRNFDIEVIEGLIITPTVIPDATRDVFYTVTLSASGGSGVGYVFSLATGSALPGNMTLSPAGIISGAPLTAGIYMFTAKVTDSLNYYGVRNYELWVYNPLEVVTTVLDKGYDESPYSAPVTAAGGKVPYSWEFVSGTLPPGLALSTAGSPSATLSGTPTTPGQYTFDVRVRDSGGREDTGTLTVRIDYEKGIIIHTGGGGCGNNGPAVDACLRTPADVALDSAGNLYICESDGHRVRKVDAATGVITAFAGTGDQSYFGDNGPAVDAMLSYPRAIAVDADDNVYIADSNNYRVRRVDALTGEITTICGNGNWGDSGDGGPADQAEIAEVLTMAYDPALDRLYLADTMPRVRFIDFNDGNIYAFAGNGAWGYSGDGGLALDAEMGGIEGIAVAPNGGVYLADTNNSVIRVVSGGNIDHFAGRAFEWGFEGDTGAAVDAVFSGVARLSFDAAGNLYLCDRGNARVRMIDTNGIIDTVAGTGNWGYGGDGGPALSADIAEPYGLVCGADGYCFTQMMWGGHFGGQSAWVRYVDFSSLEIDTVAGNGSEAFAGDGGDARDAAFYDPRAICFDADGNCYVADSNNYRVRRIDADTGIVTTIAGNGFPGYSGDGGPATQAGLGYTLGIAADAQGNVYISDGDNQRVRRISAATGNIDAYAGDGNYGFGGDQGPALAAQFASPAALAVDAQGNLYIHDQSNARVRKVAALTGIVTTVAGNGNWGYSGDGGPAVYAELSMGWPGSLAVDAQGNLFISDQDNGRVRKVTASTQTISTVAGNGNWDYTGDGGPAIQASFARIASIAVDAAGNLFIADQYNYRIRKVNASDGKVNTVGGNGQWGNTGNGGQAVQATIMEIECIALYDGNLTIMTPANNGIIRTIIGP